MNGYRRGAVLGLTVAETFLLLTFLLLLVIALVSLVESEDAQIEQDSPVIWIRPETIETLVRAIRVANLAKFTAEQTLDEALTRLEAAQRAQMVAEEALSAAEIEEDDARVRIAEARAAQRAAERMRDEALAIAQTAHRAQKAAEDTLAAAEIEEDDARARVAEARAAQKAAEQMRDEALAIAQSEQRARRAAEDALTIAETAEDDARLRLAEAVTARLDAENTLTKVIEERDSARRALEHLQLKGENPPCWYVIVEEPDGSTREKPLYVFNVGIKENSIVLSRRSIPDGSAWDDSGGPYEDEWKHLGIDELPYDYGLTEDEFRGAVASLVEQGRNRQVRTYECIFYVQLWDLTPDDAKGRWKDAHDRIIEGLFGAYTVQDDPWPGVE